MTSKHENAETLRTLALEGLDLTGEEDATVARLGRHEAMLFMEAAERVESAVNDEQAEQIVLEIMLAAAERMEQAVHTRRARIQRRPLA